MTSQNTSGSLLFADLRTRVRLSRALVIVSLALTLPWSIYFVVIGDWDGVRNIGIVASPSVVALFLFQFEYHYAARFVWQAFVPLIFLFLAIYYGGIAEPELLFIALIGFPFLFFSWETEARTLWGLVFYELVLSVVALSFDQFGSREWFIQPPPLLEQERASVVWGTRINVLLLVLAELGYLYYLLYRASKEARRALRKANDAARAKGVFLANMSHEIRTPMNGVIGMIEVLETMGLDERQASTVGTIHNSAFSLLRIIDDILDASKIDAGKLSVEMQKVELRPLIESTAQTLRGKSDNHGVRMRLYQSAAIPDWIITDPGRMRQILLNLLSNAIKYSARNLTGRVGQVHCIADISPEGKLRFVVTDNGIGMNEDVRRNLFQPFMQGEQSSHRRVSGTGLGLVITRSLVKLMGGTIKVESKEGEGTSITVDMPVKRVDGPKSFCDITGVRIVLFALTGAEAVAKLADILSTAGAEVKAKTGLNDFDNPELQTFDPEIFLLSASDFEGSDRAQKHLEKIFPEARFIRFSANRAHRFGMISANSYRIQVFPMMTTELFYAIALMAGRIAPAHLSLAAKEDEAARMSHTSKILVVEDNEINREVLSKQLEILGYPFETASNGQEGLNHWRDGKFDLVLTDCHMPLMDGFELTAAIRQEEHERGLAQAPIVAITANAMEGETENCLAAGMDSYLSKPVELRALGATIAELLGENHQGGRSPE